MLPLDRAPLESISLVRSPKRTSKDVLGGRLVVSHLCPSVSTSIHSPARLGKMLRENAQQTLKLSHTVERGRARNQGCGCTSGDSLLPELLHSLDQGPQSPPRPMPSWEQLNSRSQPVPASSEWVSEDSGSSRGAWSVPAAEGLPGWASSEVRGSCLGVEGSLCAARGPPSGLPALLSASAKKSSCQPGQTPSFLLFIHTK